MNPTALTQTPNAQDAGEPDLLARVRSLLDDLFHVFGDPDEIRETTHPPPVTRRLLAAWVRSLECAVRRLLVTMALLMLANGEIIIGPTRASRASRLAQHRADGPRQAVPRIGSGGAQRRNRSPGRNPSTGTSPDTAHQSPSRSSGVFPAESWARRVAAAAAILANPEAWARRLARRIVRAGVEAAWSPAFSSETPEADATGHRTPWLNLLEDLALALREAVESHDWPRPRESPSG